MLPHGVDQFLDVSPVEELLEHGLEHPATGARPCGNAGACLRSSPPKRWTAAARQSITAPPNKPTFPSSSVKVIASSLEPQSRAAPHSFWYGAPSGRAVSGPDFVVTEHSHEHFLVDGLPGVVEHRRDAGRVAEFRALPGNDDQRLGRFLIAQNRHAERLSSGAEINFASSSVFACASSVCVGAASVFARFSRLRSC